MMKVFKKNVLVVLLLSFVGAVGALLYCVYLSGLVEERFSGRKWKIPSTIYSDTTLIYPGKKGTLTDFEERLNGLGYRRQMEPPGKKGDYRLAAGHLVIFLNDLAVPGKTRAGFPVRLDFKSGSVESITSLETGDSLQILELEPEMIMQFFGKDRELRKIVNIKDVPESLKYALMAAEDSRFYTHFGIDPLGILRAVYTNIRSGAIRQGGSTLTQQLAKNYFLTHERTFSRKLNELFISIAIELKFEKDEILEIYLNEIYFGQKGSASVNGAGEAADFYFGKKVSMLTLSDSAVIAGLIKGPNLYSPYKNMERCVKRRNMVLESMHRKGWISSEALEQVRAEEVKVVGFEKYSKKAPYFLDYVSSQLKEIYPATTLSSMGFSIYTTLDTKVQAAAEKALEKGLARLERQKPKLKRNSPEQKLQGAIVVMQPRTGNILAMVGGRNYRVSQFNRIIQAKRQPGSCFKPIVTAALLDRFKPSDFLSNKETDYLVDDKLWSPKNFSKVKGAKLTVRDMLKSSNNRAAVDLVVRGGVDLAVERVKKFNFSTAFHPYPSIVLGSLEVSPMELARAYCTFAADGIQPYPLSLKDVVDEERNVLVGKHMDINPVISPGEAYLISSMLETAVKEGTARSLKKYGIHFPVAGKTGTTNDYKDAWFVGYTPDILALVWVGFDKGASTLSTGGTAALPIWADLVTSIPDYISGNGFTMPPDVIEKRICTESGELSTYGCGNVKTEIFLATNAPDKRCSLHAKSGFLNRIKSFFTE